MPARIAHLLASLQVGGKERVALDLALRTRKEGGEAWIVTFDAPSRGAPSDLDPGDLPRAFFQREPGLDRTLGARLRGFLKEHSIEVLHAHNETAVVYGAHAVRGGGARLVATLHTYPGHDTWGARFLHRRAIRRAHSVTVVSDELGRRMVSKRWIRSFETIPNGVDLDRFVPPAVEARDSPPCSTVWRPRLGLPTSIRLVGCVARLDPIKRHVDLLEAMERLPEDVHLCLAGDGAERAELRRIASERVHFAPHVEDVPGFLREVDAIVLASDHEGMPCSLLEAMACGRPIVATAVGGVPELVGDAARLVPPREPQLLARALADVLEDPGDLPRAARRRAEFFSLDSVWRSYRRLYAP